MLVFISMLTFANNTIKNLKGSFSGVVTDASTGKPLSNVSVYISDSKTGTTTNAKGEYNLSNISEGVHLVEYSHIGFGTHAEQILIKGDTKKDIALVEAIVENNAVVITGVSRASQLRKMPFQVSVLRKEELQQSAATNIIDAITRKAGVSSIATGPAISKPVIRGLGYNRVLTLNDGVRQEGQQWGDEHGIEIDETSVNKIEILKGPASLVYGSDAMAGVINIITNVPVALNKIKSNIGTNYQTNNKLKSLYGNVAGNINGFNWNLYGSTKAVADYKNKYDDYVYNSKFKEKNIGGYVGYNGKWGFSHLIISNFNLKAGLIEGARDSLGHFLKVIPGGADAEATTDDFKSTKPNFPYQHIKHFKIATDNNINIGNNKLALNIGYQRNQRQEYGDIDNPTQQALYFDLATTTYAAQFHVKETNGWKPSIGINGMNQTNTNRGLEQLIPNYNLSDIGVFLFAAKEYKKITFSGGARFDIRNITAKDLLDDVGTVKGNAFAKNYNNISGSAGVAYQATKSVNVKINIAKAFRAPSIPELASNGTHEGTIRYEYGDINLKSEISTQADASLEINNEHFSLNLAGFANNFNNFIFYRKLESTLGGDSLVNVGGDFITAFKFEQKKAMLTGAEITFDLHPHPVHWLHFQNTFSYVSGLLKNAVEGTRNLPFIPAPKLLTELRADFKKLNKYFTNTYAKIELDNTFVQNKAFTAYQTETATNGYSLINIGVGANIVSAKGNTIFTINLSANNIGNVAYQNHLSRLKYAEQNMATGRNGVFNMGRNFSIKVNVPLEF